MSGDISPNTLGNFHGVFISGASGNTVGGTVPEAANTISGNANQGVMVLGDAATGNGILRNSISDNGSPVGLGIELNNDGVTPNDRRPRRRPQHPAELPRHHLRQRHHDQRHP